MRMPTLALILFCLAAPHALALADPGVPAPSGAYSTGMVDDPAHSVAAIPVTVTVPGTAPAIAWQRLLGGELISTRPARSSRPRTAGTSCSATRSRPPRPET